MKVVIYNQDTKEEGAKEKRFEGKCYGKLIPI
jgi:hypothetical protein